MAKSKTFFGLRTGSTKSHTYSVLDGVQITKERVSQVKNPRTQAQMDQRALMRTVINAYSAGKEIFDHSTQGVGYGAKNMSAFVSRNLKLLQAAAPAINLSSYGSSAAVVNPLIVAEGSLNPLSKKVFKSNFPTDIYFGKAGDNVKPTYKDLLDAFGILKGDYLTCVMFLPDYTTDSEDKFSADFGWIRFAVPEEIDETKDLDKNKLQVWGSSNMSFDMNDATAELPAYISVNMSIKDGRVDSSMVHTFAAGWIKSHKAANGWQRSTCPLTVYKATGQTPLLNYADAIMTYPTGNALNLNGNTSSTPANGSKPNNLNPAVGG